MTIEWTEQGKRGWREVAAYVKREFGQQGLLLFKQRTKDIREARCYILCKETKSSLPTFGM